MKQMKRRRVLFIICSIAILFSGGCGIFRGGGGGQPEVKKPDKHPLVLKFMATDRLNSCGDETGNALAVRVYQLTSDETISGASLSRLWDHEAGELKDDLLDQVERILDPGKSETVPVSLKPGVQSIAVAGNFCKSEGDCWRWIHTLKGLEGQVELTFDEFCIRQSPKASQ